MLNGWRDLGFGGLDVRGLGNYFDGLLLAVEHQLKVSCDAIANREDKRIDLVNLEIRSAVDTYLVLPRRESEEVVPSGIIRNSVPFGTGGPVGHRNLRASYCSSGGVEACTRKGSSIHTLPVDHPPAYNQTQPRTPAR